MALPTLVKTWNITTNQLVPTQTSKLESQKQLFKNIADFFIASGWTKVAASNGTTASTTTSWSSTSDVNFNNTNYNRSWMVLRNSALSTSYDVCIDLGNSYPSWWGNIQNDVRNTGNFSIYVAPSGYNISGTLSTSSRPSTNVASEEQQIATSSGDSQSQGMFFGNTNPAFVWNGWCSSDKEVTRMSFYSNDSMMGYISFEKVHQPVSGWSVPVIAIWLSYNNYSNIDLRGFYSNTWTYGRINTANYSMYQSGEGYTSGMLSSALGIPNDISGEYPMIPVGVCCTTPPVRGRHGGLYDVWYSGGLTNGSTFPDSSGATRKFVYNSGIVLPWDGSVPVIR